MKFYLNYLLSFLMVFMGLVNPVLAQTSPGKRVDGTIFTGKNILDTNYVKAPQPYNPSDLNSNTTATSSATLTRDTSGGNLFQGLPSYQCDTSANAGYCEFKLNPVKEPAVTGNCMAMAYVKGDGTLYSLQITDGTTARVSAGLSNALSTGYGVPFIVNFPCQATPTVRITQTTAGTSPAINIGVVGYGLARNIGSGVPNNVFSAKVSSGGVVTDENEDWISGNCSAGSPSTCTLVPGKFNVPPTCNITYGPSVSSFREIAMNSVSTSSISLNTYNSSGSASANNVMVVCTRAGTDFIQPAITPNQWNYDWTAANLSTTQQGFGTVTYTNAMDCRHKRQGSDLLFECKFTAGTVAASEARITLPNGLTVDSTKTPAIRQVGQWWRGNSSASAYKRGAIIVTGGNSFIQFSVDDYSNVNNPFTALNGTTFAANSDVINFTARVPIAGWTENQNAPQLLGSVTSNSSKALRIEKFRVYGSGTNAVCNSSPCLIDNESTPGFATVTRTAGGTYTVSFPSGGFSDIPSCSFFATNVSNTLGVFGNGVPTSTSYPIQIYTFANSAVDVQLFVTCIGAR